MIDILISSEYITGRYSLYINIFIMVGKDNRSSVMIAHWYCDAAKLRECGFECWHVL